MPTTMTCSQGAVASARTVASRARAGPMPVTSATTDQFPATPVWLKTVSPPVGRNPKDVTIALSSGCIGASTTTRLVGVGTASS